MRLQVQRVPPLCIGHISGTNYDEIWIQFGDEVKIKAILSYFFISFTINFTVLIQN
jgi:hypothetical protein